MYSQYEMRSDYMVGYLKSGQEFLFDVNDFETIQQYKWVFDNGYVRMSPTHGKRVFLHNFLLGSGRGDEGLFVDHINHDKLDNRRCNLRVATKSQNGMNRSLQANSTTGFIGVSYMPQRGKYRARIKKDGREQHLGLFITAEQAAIAYDSAAIRLHGTFAYTNFERRQIANEKILELGAR
ncbi:HNH endonuclease [Mobilitalea sibirica]|uniref:HNH endonuclease n=1 Tax=Mobilitalea sibirica TaxID=1462919 RepID=A0A8J7HDX8_9FIRM|nr:HNH endonuclease [Mobilitalea sibirica]MBH1941314.1 HNH endonuclease [Mobilitalea sibirica]